MAHGNDSPNSQVPRFTVEADTPKNDATLEYMNKVEKSLTDLQSIAEKAGTTMENMSDIMKKINESNSAMVTSIGSFSIMMNTVNTQTTALLEVNKQITDSIKVRGYHYDENLTKEQNALNLAKQKQENEQAAAIKANTEAQEKHKTEMGKTAAMVANPMGAAGTAINNMLPQLRIAMAAGGLLKGAFDTARGYEKMAAKGGGNVEEVFGGVGNMADMKLSAKWNAFMGRATEEESQSAMETLIKGGFKGDKLKEAMDKLAESAEKAGMKLNDLAPLIVKLENKENPNEAPKPEEEHWYKKTQAQKDKEAADAKVANEKQERAAAAQSYKYLTDSHTQWGTPNAAVGKTEEEYIADRMKQNKAPELAEWNAKTATLQGVDDITRMAKESNIADIASIQANAATVVDKAYRDIEANLKNTGGFDKADKGKEGRVVLSEVGKFFIEFDNYVKQGYITNEKLSETLINKLRAGESLSDRKVDGKDILGITSLLKQEIEQNKDRGITTTEELGYRDQLTKTLLPYYKDTSHAEEAARESLLPDGYLEGLKTHAYDIQTLNAVMPDMISKFGKTPEAATTFAMKYDTLGKTLDIKGADIASNVMSLSKGLMQLGIAPEAAINMGQDIMTHEIAKLINKGMMSTEQVTSIMKLQMDVFGDSTDMAKDRVTQLAKAVETAGMRMTEMTEFMTANAAALKKFGVSEDLAQQARIAFNSYIHSTSMSLQEFTDFLKGPLNAAPGMGVMTQDKLKESNTQLGKVARELDPLGFQALTKELAKAASGDAPISLLTKAFDRGEKDNDMTPEGKATTKAFYASILAENNKTSNKLASELMKTSGGGTNDFNQLSRTQILSKDLLGFDATNITGPIKEAIINGLIDGLPPKDIIARLGNKEQDIVKEAIKKQEQDQKDPATAAREKAEAENAVKMAGAADKFSKAVDKVTNPTPYAPVATLTQKIH